VEYSVTTLTHAQCKRRFCSRECQRMSQISGLLRKDQETIWVEKYGVVTPLNMSGSRDRLREALLNGGLDKTKETLQAKYGVDNPMKIAGVPARQQQSIRDKRNGSHHLEIEEGLEKRRQTCVEIYGYDHVMKVPSIIEAFPFKEVWLKSHATKKKNGTYKRSKDERTFEAWLRMVFGKCNVERGVIVNGWSIDFRINIGDSSFYIQFDGDYWHGKDVGEAQLFARKNKQALRIQATFMRDKQQRTWFTDNKLDLQRVTDKEFERFIWQRRKTPKQLRALRRKMSLATISSKI